MCNGGDEKQIGRIKWFNNKKGFGFLSNSLTNEDVFVHHTGIKLSEASLNSDVNIFKTVIEGEYVSYEKHIDNEGRSVAKNVTGICGGPLLCENTTKKIFVSNRHTEKNSSEGGSVNRSSRKQSSSSDSGHSHDHAHVSTDVQTSDNSFGELVEQ